MSTSQVITKNAPRPISAFAISNSTTERRNALSSQLIDSKMNYIVLKVGDFATSKPRAITRRPEWEDREYRQAYMEASIEEGIAWQIRANRIQRGLSQQDVADTIQSTQSGISRLEDPEYGKHSIETLLKLANAFDCALSVKFISYSKLAEDSEDLSPAAMYAEPFSVELKYFEGNKIER